ncbi:MAG: hypothetical protein KC416_16360, partial [Myxococcales bacterium]|nr:hypothetical protein [Myxococcales bacterium]
LTDGGAPRPGRVAVVGADANEGDGNTPQNRNNRRIDWSSEEGFETSIVAQRMRRAKMKQALIEKHRLRRPAIERIEVLQQKLNDKLAPYGEEVSLLMQDREKDPNFSTVLTLTQDVTGILAESQDELDAIVGEPTKLEDKDSQVWNLIDLETFRPAAEALRKRTAEGTDSPPSEEGTEGNQAP